MVPVSEQLASIELVAENRRNVNAVHSMRLACTVECRKRELSMSHTHTPHTATLALFPAAPANRQHRPAGHRHPLVAQTRRGQYHCTIASTPPVGKATTLVQSRAAASVSDTTAARVNITATLSEPLLRPSHVGLTSAPPPSVRFAPLPRPRLRCLCFRARPA